MGLYPVVVLCFVLHGINYAASYADWSVGLREGQLVASGLADKILTSQTIEDIFGIRVEIHQIGGKKVVMHYS